MTIDVDGLTPYGATPEDVARTLDDAGADVIGLNCSVGPQTILDAIEKMAAVTQRKLSAQPNAGMPREVGGRSMYMASPEYMATYARHLVQAGAKVIGGCCGTTPDHIKSMVEGIRPLVPRLESREAAGARARGTSRVRLLSLRRRSCALQAKAYPACHSPTGRAGRGRSRVENSSRRSKSFHRAASMRRACWPMSKHSKQPASTR